ncbi:MAG: Phospho-N-acetylmuramoyl-pentapeptide-transferase [Verrucomicrobiae bacterium]|nr:Phospho-N-acetylmuramoyl-pentapeptide-transferase [Verrucomicrobiae bacterium]
MLFYLSQLTEYFTPLRVFQYTTFRAVFAAITAMLICVVTGPWMIRKLAELKFGQPIRGADDLGPLAEKHGHKTGTPTMGGVLILWAVIDATILWARPDNPLVLLCLATVLCLGFVGFLDDFAKVTKRNSKGISSKTKFAAQMLCGIALGVYLGFHPTVGEIARQFYLPFVKLPVILDMGIFMLIWFAFVLTSASNAVNLTDGMDGLAIGCTLTAALAFTVMTFVAGNAKLASYLTIPFVPGAAELTVVCAALIGASLGFLWFNCHPAEVFMGDTGSLAIGGLIGAIALMIKQELVLIIVGGIFVMEAASVVIQVAGCKLRGKSYRIFKRTPIHHHFEELGWSETKITTRFWILSVIFALLGLATLKLR